MFYMILTINVSFQNNTDHCNDAQFVFCEARTEFLNIIWLNFRLQRGIVFELVKGLKKLSKKKSISSSFRSVHGFADTDMQTILGQLQREEEDLCGHRGLVPGTDQQTFQMAVPLQLRSYYHKVMAPVSSVSEMGRTQFL
jgi:hypothetical protein